MQTYLLLALLSAAAHLTQAQTFFDYDQAGNRIKRYSIPVPDLSPSLYVRPTSVSGARPMSLVLELDELNNAPSTGPITVYITKNTTLFPFSFDPSATLIDGRPVQNALWSFDATTHQAYYILTTTAVVAPWGILSVGLSGTSVGGRPSGTIGLSAVILGGSGGELKLTNNSAATRIDYFSN